MKALYAIIGLLLLWSSCSAPAKPKMDFIIDSADVFTTNQAAEIKNELEHLEQTTHDKLRLVTVRNCKPEKDLRTFAGKYFNSSDLAIDTSHHNILVVFCTECHEVDIHTNSYPDGRLSQVVTRSIVDTIMVPQFKYDRHYEGIKRGITAIIALLDTTKVSN